MPGVRNDLADMVGQAAVGVGNIGAALDQKDLGIFIQATQASRARGTASHATDNQDLFIGHKERSLAKPSPASNKTLGVFGGAVFRLPHFIMVSKME